MISIRPVSQPDLELVLDIYRQCEDFLALGPIPYASMEMILADLEHSRQSGGRFCLIFVGAPTAETAAGIVDYIPAGYEGKDDQAFLTLLMIAGPHRERGIGGEVVRQIEAEICQGSATSKILSGVQVNNPSAIRFWKRMGYQITGGPELLADQTTVYHLEKELRKR